MWELLTQAAWVERIGWTLVHSLWQFTLLSLAAIVLQRLLTGRAATTRYATLLVAMSMMVAAPLATWFSLGPADAPLSAAALNSVENRPSAVPSQRGDAATAAPAPVAESPAGLATQPEAEPRRLPSAPKASAFSWASLKGRVQPWLPTIVLLWLAGLVVAALRPLLSWCRVRRLRRTGVSPIGDALRGVLERTARRLGVARRIEALRSTLVKTPMVVGYFRPVVLLPLCVATGLPERQIELILAHELAHVRRHDYLINWIQTLVETLFFYHPAVWWLSREIRNERENCCDDAAMAVVGSRVEYGRALLAIEELRATSPVLPLAAGGGSLLARIRRIAGYEAAPSVVFSSGILGIVLASMVLVGAGLWGAAPAAGDVPKAPPPPKVESTPGPAPSATPKLRYGFQADREYAYQVEMHAKVVEEKIDRQGELIYKVLSANENQVVLKTSGSAGQWAHLGSMPFPRMGPPMFMHQGPQGTTISRRGTVLISGELTHLPMLLGDLETLAIEEFPEEPKPTWEKQRDIVIEETESSSRFGPRFGPPMHMPGSTKTTQYTAKEVVQFTIAQNDDQTVRVTKKYSLKSSEKDKVVRFDMTGSGEFEFDRKEGAIGKSSMTYEMKVNESGVSLTIPITVTARLLSASEWAERKKKQEASAKAAQAAAAEAARPKSFKPGERQELIEQLTSSNDRTLIAAAERLAKAIRDDHPDDFARPLALALSHSNAWVQAAAAKALVVWATPAAEDALVKLVKVDNFMYCRPAIEALTTLNTAKAAEAVASQMPRYRGEAGKALKTMGAIAEPAAIALLKYNEYWIRRETVGVLAEIGGKDALKALQEIAGDGSEHESRDVREAVNTIQRRLAGLPKETSSSRRHTAGRRPARGVVPGAAHGAAHGAATPPQSSSAAKDQEMRTWHDTSGKFEIEAVLVSVKGETVTLKTKDGRTIPVPLKKLSAEDQKFIAEQAQAAFGGAGTNP
jgi:beta-lactamase regulating signal transducer with metallopeptidase domain